MAASVKGYRKALDKISDSLAGKLAEAIDGFDFTAKFDRYALEDAMAAVCETGATASAGVSAKFYNATRVEQTGESITTVVHSGYRRSKTETAVQELLAAYDLSGDADALMQGLIDHIDSCVRMGARGCMGANARNDAKEPRWASVPGGISPCDYCTQIAAAGFYAKSPIQPIHPPYCKCSTIPGFDGAKSRVAGYDQKYWEARYEENKAREQ